MEFKVMKPDHIFIVKSSVKEFLNENNMWFSEKSVEQLNKTMKENLLKAIERAKLNGRKKVFPQDYI